MKKQKKNASTITIKEEKLEEEDVMTEEPAVETGM